jgi:hypothetical protein
MNRGRWTFVLLGVLGFSSAAQAQFTYNEQFVGPEAGIFFPQSQALKDALGDSWASFGVGQTKYYGYGTRRRPTKSWSAVSKRANGNHVFALSASYGYVFPLSNPDDGPMPFFAVRGGASYIDYGIGPSESRLSGKRLGMNANAEFGVVFNSRFSMSARYDVYPEHDGISFNGLTLEARYGIVRF